MKLINDKMQQQDIYVMNLLFRLMLPPNYLEDTKPLLIAGLRMLHRVFPIDSSRYFHYNNKMHHFPDLLLSPTWQISD